MKNKIVIGNWKMNGNRALVQSFFSGKIEIIKEYLTVVLCLPHIFLYEANNIAKKQTIPVSISVGAQDCSHMAFGSMTGDISAKMLKGIDIRYVMVGHSERRRFCKETNETVAQKTLHAVNEKLTPILCCGEEKGQARTVIKDQVCSVFDTIFSCTSSYVSSASSISSDNPTIRNSFYIAYEPVWCIGTSIVPESKYIDETINFIKDSLVKKFPSLDNYFDIRFLYGGSVDEHNVSNILTQCQSLDGVLVGSASLLKSSFVKILNK